MPKVIGHFVNKKWRILAITLGVTNIIVGELCELLIA